MASYDLRDSNNFGWVRFQRWFSLGLRAFVVVMAVAIAYDAYLVATARQTVLDFVALGFLLWVWSLFFWIALNLRPPAESITIDDQGIRLDFSRGHADIRQWGDPKVRVRGRQTDGVGDSISRGVPLQSVFGPRGGFQETFLPRPALVEVFEKARGHGLAVSIVPGRPGWSRYIISR